MPVDALEQLGRRARRAARQVARSSSATRDEALLTAADLLVAECPTILEANALDLAAAEATVPAGGGAGSTAGGRAGSTGGGRAGSTAPLDATALDRLRLTTERVEAMAESLRAVAALSDPVGEVVDGWVRPNGLTVQRVRAPLGVVGIIYENRPNVTSDAAALCLKAGNAAFLRGSSSALESNRAVVQVLQQGLAKAGLPEDAVLLVEEPGHDVAIAFMQLREYMDCLVPRGGRGLVSSLLEHATVPYVLDGDGNCHVYVDAAADLAMAERIVVNAKMQRPSVCNAAETLLVHASVAEAFLPRVADALSGVRLLAEPRAAAYLPDAEPATNEDFATEFLGLTMTVAVVDDLDAALEHISRYGTGHSEAIVTTALDTADRFTREVDAGAVVVNASTRFVDGGELGLGAEVGISTQKLHARGPMGLRELTAAKWVVRGQGQVRG